MKSIKLKESDLINLIEKLVKENVGFGNGQNFGLMGTPSAKYKDLVEDSDIEEDYETEDHDDRDEFDGRKSKVVGVDSDIDKQSIGEQLLSKKSRCTSFSKSKKPLLTLIKKFTRKFSKLNWKLIPLSIRLNMILLPKFKACTKISCSVFDKLDDKGKESAIKEFETETTACIEESKKRTLSLTENQLISLIEKVVKQTNK